MQRFAIVPVAVFVSSLFLSQAATAAICPMIFAPVCAIKDRVERTYPNACLARNAHARILYRGRCRLR